MAGLAPSDSDSESSVYTEPSLDDLYRESFEPFRVEASNPFVGGFRQWWLKNPLNNLWTKKPNLWRTYQSELTGLSPAEAVKSGANVRLADLVQRGPTLEEALEQEGYDMHPLPSDEAWFGEPDPTKYAEGTNDLTKEQLAEEVAKGNVCTLRQLKEHLLTATDDELAVWQKLFAARKMKDKLFVNTAEGRVSLWDLLMYVKDNPELEKLAQRDINLAVPVEGMTREERIAQLVELAPWRLCANDRQMHLPPSAAAKLPWGMLAGNTWWHRRPIRWLKGLGGEADFYYGMYVHEAAAQQLMNDKWGGRCPEEVLADKAFYREAVGLAPQMGMTLLAVASRPLPLQQLTMSWQERMQQQIDKISQGQVAGSSSKQPKVFMSTGADTTSGSEEGSSEATSGSSSEIVAAAAAVYSTPAAGAKASEKATIHATTPAASTTATPPPAGMDGSPSVQQGQQQQLYQQQPPAPTATQPHQQQLRLPPSSAASMQMPGQQVETAASKQQPAAQLTRAQESHLQHSAVQTLQTQTQAVAQPAKNLQPRHAALAHLASLFDQKVLSADTELLDMRGTKLREGAMIMFTAHPSGALLVQAVSPGFVKEQKSYVLGSVMDAQLTHALMSMFMDPDHTLDPEFTTAAGTTLLAFVNGFRQGQQKPPTPVVPGNSLEEGRRLLQRGKWRLPALGQPPEQEPLLSGVRRAVVHEQISSAFESALRAAAAVEVPEGADLQDAAVQKRMLWERRHAAEKELKHQLSKLGLDTSTLSLQEIPALEQQKKASWDLLSLARPLA